MNINIEGYVDICVCKAEVHDLRLRSLLIGCLIHSLLQIDQTVTKAQGFNL